jgi:hypothetical protein
LITFARDFGKSRRRWAVKAVKEVTIPSLALSFASLPMRNVSKTEHFRLKTGEFMVRKGRGDDDGRSKLSIDNLLFDGLAQSRDRRGNLGKFLVRSAEDLLRR